MRWTWFLLSFSGRINRKPFWLFWLVIALTYLVFAVLLAVLPERLGSIELYLGGFLTLAIWPILAVQAKRWHDRGKSAWWIFIYVIPTIGTLWFIIECGFGRGESGPNRFGSDPLEESAGPGNLERSYPALVAALTCCGILAMSHEGYRIPSNAMMPTLLTGDFIIATPFSYGIPMPFTDRELFSLANPRRCDVIIFRYPEDPTTPFIKRVVGVPGDTVSYTNKYLIINGERVEQEDLGRYTGHGSGVAMTGASLRLEHLPERAHKILIMESGSDGRLNPFTISDGEYFVLGDNRDNSRDSRYWGFVPRDHLIARARWVYFHWDWGHGINLGRTGKVI